MGDIPAKFRDQWGRYLLPHPVTGEPTSFQRATTFNKLISNRHTLEEWGKRMVLVGVGRRRDLYAQLQSMCHNPGEYRDELNKIVRTATEAAEAGANANIGDALHRFCELADRGSPVPVSAEWAADLEAYKQATARWSHLAIEAVTCIPELGVAGTTDRLSIRTAGGMAVVADIKTGDIKFAMPEISMQLALYAHGIHDHGVFNFDLEEWIWIDRAEVDLDVGLIIHLPFGTGTCHIYEVDIAAGWKACAAAKRVRDWQTHSKTKIRGDWWESKLARLATIPAPTTQPVAGGGGGGPVDDDSTRCPGQEESTPPAAVVVGTPEGTDTSSTVPEEVPTPRTSPPGVGTPPMSQCKSCGAIIEWHKTAAGKMTPTDPDGTSHFATCPNAEQHRGKPVHLHARHPTVDVPLPDDDATGRANLTFDMRRLDLTVNIRRRLRTLAKSDRAKQLILNAWPTHIPKTLARDGEEPWQLDHCDEILALLKEVEMEVGAPFDPPNAEPRPLPETVSTLEDLMQNLPSDLQTLVQHELAERGLPHRLNDVKQSQAPEVQEILEAAHETLRDRRQACLNAFPIHKDSDGSIEWIHSSSEPIIVAALKELTARGKPLSAGEAMTAKEAELIIATGHAIADSLITLDDTGHLAAPPQAIDLLGGKASALRAARSAGITVRSANELLNDWRNVALAHEEHLKEGTTT